MVLYISIRREREREMEEKSKTIIKRQVNKSLDHNSIFIKTPSCDNNLYRSIHPPWVSRQLNELVAAQSRVILTLCPRAKHGGGSRRFNLDELLVINRCKVIAVGSSENPFLFLSIVN